MSAHKQTTGMRVLNRLDTIGQAERISVSIHPTALLMSNLKNSSGKAVFLVFNFSSLAPFGERHSLFQCFRDCDPQPSTPSARPHLVPLMERRPLRRMEYQFSPLLPWKA